MQFTWHVLYLLNQLTISLICFGSRLSFYQRSISYDKRSNSSVNLSMISLQQLELEHKTFQGWVRAWLDSQAASIPQIEQDMQAYDGWISAWLASATSTSNPLSMGSPTDSGSSATSSMAEKSLSVSALLESTAVVTQASVTDTTNEVGIATPTHPSTVSVSNTQKGTPLGNSLAVYYGQSEATARVTLA